MTYLIPFLLSLLISVFLTGILRGIGYKYGIVSKPRPRDVHKKPIPRIGGVAIFVSFIIVIGIMAATYQERLNLGYSFWWGLDKHIMAICLGGVVITLSMLLDDIYGLSAWKKLFFQFLAVLILIAAGVGINTLSNPFGPSLDLNTVYIPIFYYHGVVYHFSLFSDLLTLFWIIGMMNTINFVDGVDGLAGGISFIALVTIFLLSVGIHVNQPGTALIAITLAGSTLGFLCWNFPPAKIFMGDAGAMFLGFILGSLALISGGKLATVFLVLGFPIVDGLFVVLSRIYRGKNPFTTPDKTHLHHRFLKAGYTARQAILFIYIISIIFAWVALRSTTRDKLLAAMILVAALFLLTRVLNNKAKQNSVVANHID